MQGLVWPATIPKDFQREIPRQGSPKAWAEANPGHPDFLIIITISLQQKFRKWETLTLLTYADSSTVTMKSPILELLFAILGTF